MVDYDPHRWTQHFFDVRGSMVRDILGRVLACVVWAAAVVAFHRWVHPVSVPATPHTLVGTALGLLLVFRTNASYDRFWEGRKLWGGIVNETRNLGRSAGVFLAPEPGLLRELLHWTAAFPYAAAGVLRGGAPELGPSAEALPAERVARVRASQHVALAVARQASALLDAGRRQGLYGEVAQVSMDQNLQQLVDYLGGCERIHRTPLPFAYVVHLRRALVLYCFTLPFALVDGFGWLTVAATLLIAYVFFGIEEIGVEIEDPFGHDDNDLPLDRICQTIRGNLLGMLPEEAAGGAPGRAPAPPVAVAGAGGRGG
jgi:putative membrane protein